MVLAAVAVVRESAMSPFSWLLSGVVFGRGC